MQNLKARIQKYNLNLKIFLLTFTLFVLRYILLPVPVSAHCPLCVGGAVIGLSVARFLGVDDSISGLWMAAFLGAISFWIANRFKSYFKPIIYVAVFGLTIWSFYAFNSWAVTNLKFFLINTHLSKILGFDRLTFGLIFGGSLFYLVDFLDSLIIKRHGKVYFPYQKIFVSLGSILVASIIMFLVIG